MEEIDWNGKNYGCGHCGRAVRMVKRTLEEVVSGAKEMWFHIDDDTLVCPSKDHCKRKTQKNRKVDAGV